MRYQVHKKATSKVHRYGALENHTQETYAHVNTADATQSLICAEMEDKEEMANLASINLTLYKVLTQAQETMLVLSKELKELHTKAKANTLTTDKTVLDKKKKETKSKCYFWNHGRTCRLDHTSATYLSPPKGQQVGETLGNRIGGSGKY